MPSNQCLSDGGFYSESDIFPSAIRWLSDGSYTGTYPDYYDNCDEYYQEMQDWKKKSVKLWNGTDIVHWMNYIAKEINICPTDIMSEKFYNLDGYQLSCLSESDFLSKEPAHGRYLYRKLQDVLDNEGRSFTPSVLMNYSHNTKENDYYIKAEERPYIPSVLRNCEQLMNEDYIKKDELTLTRLEVTTKFGTLPLTPSPSPPPPLTPVPAKKGRGRPRLTRRKKKTEKLGRLWEFLRDLLKNPAYCPSLILWENHDEGMFRFVHSDKVAKLWGDKKDNPDMNYEKLSRAMRYYYKSEVLLPVIGRRLVYKFGPSAKNWRVENPNFKKQI